MEKPILERRGANFFGFERIDSSGKLHHEPWVWRGNGDLRLMHEGLHFRRWLPGKQFFIPIETITKVELGRWHNRKTKWPAIVVKVFYTEDGLTRVFGASPGLRPEAERWKRAIESAIVAGKRPRA